MGRSAFISLISEGSNTQPENLTKVLFLEIMIL